MIFWNLKNSASQENCDGVNLSFRVSVSLLEQSEFISKKEYGIFVWPEGWVKLCIALFCRNNFTGCPSG
uniref:Uncharacterized protein n=1 Tax=Rhizoctonia solani TaxID=456999 RepID=N0ABR6_9AGAM|nr:hypothetical protein RSOL_m00380 [Rhizoctonia solani]AGK45373.1 hypothetical protein RSOL_m00380 [Rhizoctonia solani]